MNRRDFLKISAASLAGLAATPLSGPPPPSDPPMTGMLGRVSQRTAAVYLRPDFGSRRLRKAGRDTLLPLLEEVISPAGPDYNPRWYRLSGGFIHSGPVQRVEEAHLNQPQADTPETGRLGEVTAPYTQTIYKNRQGVWIPLYRLYYQSIHWVTGQMTDRLGQVFYRLTDEWLRVNYYVPAERIHLLEPAQLDPVSPRVPPEEKRIEVSLKGQWMAAYEGNQQVFEAPVSTGLRYMETPAGEFRIDRKHPSKHMGDGGLTSDPNAYELPGVPWTCFFHEAGIAFHGCYWHDNFGTPMSRGCVNMRVEDARWLFNWCSPAYGYPVSERAGWKVLGKGTRVKVF